MTITRWRKTRFWRLAVVCLAVTFGAGACGCEPEPPPPLPPQTQAPTPPKKSSPPKATATPSGPQSTNACGIAEAPAVVLTPEEAEDAAAEAVAEARTDPEIIDDDGTVPLVIVEDTANDVGFTAVAVRDEHEARAVARQASETGNVIAVEVEEPVYALETFPPNDARFSQQWGLQANKTTFGAAWSKATGSSVTVAVLDTGVQANHPDLAGKVTAGKTFIPGEPSGTDLHGHGTHVAGIVGAHANNGIGVAGAAPGVEILSIQVLDKNGKGSTWTVAQGIHEARTLGADVITMSLGASSGTDHLEQAVKTAYAAGIPMVAAAGNDGGKTASGYAPGVHCVWPAGYPETITVASVDPNLGRSSFSNRGTFLDVAAPGRDIHSTWRGSTYATASGTSMAAPFVAAAVAMLVERCGDRTSSWYRAEIRKAGHQWPSKNINLGYGRVDPKKALDQAC